MADFVVLEHIDDGRLKIQFTVGALAGRTVMAYPDQEHLATSRGGRRFLSPYERAERLLLSLLTDEQANDWKARQRFRFSSIYGALEFGRISDIGFWPRTGGELRLCVLPTGDALPEPDIWTNLLLALKADPSWFFAVANWRRPPDRVWNFGPVPGFETWQ
jgi:hypothetical protein